MTVLIVDSNYWFVCLTIGVTVSDSLNSGCVRCLMFLPCESCINVYDMPRFLCVPVAGVYQDTRKVTFLSSGSMLCLLCVSLVCMCGFFAWFILRNYLYFVCIFMLFVLLLVTLFGLFWMWQCTLCCLLWIYFIW